MWLKVKYLSKKVKRLRQKVKSVSCKATCGVERVLANVDRIQYRALRINIWLPAACGGIAVKTGKVFIV